MSNINNIVKNCIGCNKCTKHCNFLSKYSINLFEFANREDLKNSCFLCNKCQNVCPVSISGKEVAIELRKSNPKHSISAKIKKNYIFKSFPKKITPTVLYLGCNYPGIYPKTVEKLVSICNTHGIEYLIDCCKKPLIENGIDYNFNLFEEEYYNLGIRKLICTCPNCYYLFKKEFKNIEIYDVYSFLYKNKIGRQISEEANIFLPCSDRYELEIFKNIEPYLTNYKLDTFQKVNCCGLGGGARKHEPELLEETSKSLHEINADNIYTYCSSCSGIFSKYGLNNIKNILSEILDIRELPSSKYMNNVFSYKIKRR